jgi:N-acetylmuramoyl-L-alanine amidase
MCAIRDNVRPRRSTNLHQNHPFLRYAKIAKSLERRTGTRHTLNIGERPPHDAERAVLPMAVVKANSEHLKLLARLMRAEAEGEGELGMLMVGNVGVNRVRANCLDFRGIRSIQDMVYQSPGGFEAVRKPYFYQAARERDVALARRVVNGERQHPATNALWFFRPTGDCPSSWYNQRHTGRFKSHCFFAPDPGDCPRIYP